MKVKCIGNVFRNRWHIFTEFGTFGFKLIVCFLIQVKCVRLKCALNKLPVVRKFTVIILAFIFCIAYESNYFAEY